MDWLDEKCGATFRALNLRVEGLNKNQTPLRTRKPENHSLINNARVRGNRESINKERSFGQSFLLRGYKNNPLQERRGLYWSP